MEGQVAFGGQRGFLQRSTQLADGRSSHTQPILLFLLWCQEKTPISGKYTDRSQVAVLLAMRFFERGSLRSIESRKLQYWVEAQNLVETYI